MRHYSVINTHNAPDLWVTLRAIGVCTWACVADAAHGVRVSTAALWRQYRQASAEDRAWRSLHKAEPLPTGWPVDEQAELLDESALESMARELGTPGWLSATAWAVLFAGVAIELVGGWPVLIDLVDAIGAALQRLARS